MNIMFKRIQFTGMVFFGNPAQVLNHNDKKSESFSLQCTH